MSAHPQLFIGLMSGTSLDGVDGVLAAFSDQGTPPITTRAAAYIPFPEQLRTDLLALQQSGDNEIHREALAANALAALYSACVQQLLAQTHTQAGNICAIGVHGQTIRHRPELGFTRQTNNPSLLAEHTDIDVIADFRSRDIAAGGQGAPLVPAFHQAIFGSKNTARAVVNIGGFSNISILPAAPHKNVSGFDTGPGNILMDGWIARHLGHTYDASGAWAATGKVHAALLAALLNTPFFAAPPPKSTGRDAFHLAWLDDKLSHLPAVPPEDVQATLCALTAQTIAQAIASHAPATRTAYICGGGAYNNHLMSQLKAALLQRQQNTDIQSTDALGVAPHHVEALAFAWLAHRFVTRQPGNLPAVTGAKGLRILGALYPA